MSPVILNRRARREFEIIDTYEAGIILSGPEVKSLRLGRANIGDAYADPREGELWLINFQESFFSFTCRKLLLLLVPMVYHQIMKEKSCTSYF